MELDVKRRKADPDLRQIKEKRIKKNRKRKLVFNAYPSYTLPYYLSTATISLSPIPTQTLTLVQRREATKKIEINMRGTNMGGFFF